MDGNKTVGIVKPIGTQERAIESLRSYLETRIRNLLMIVDQENKDVEEKFDDFSLRLKEKGCKSIEKLHDRVKKYDCELGSKRFSFIILINGLDDVHTRSHCIEDHLIRFAQISEVENDSKSKWNKLPEE